MATKLIFIVIALSSLAYVSADSSASESFNSTEVQETYATTLSQWIVDFVSKKILSLARFFDLKLRLARFLVSLYTRENLVLLRRLLEEAVKFGNFTLSFLPTSVDDPPYWWFPNIPEFINTHFGDTGLFGLVFGPVSGGNPVDEESSEESENATNPPVFFNSKSDTRRERSAVEETNDKPTVRSEGAKTNEIPNEAVEILNKKYDENESLLREYNKRAMTLDKLINAGRDY